jgi:hypothetical protein
MLILIGWTSGLGGICVTASELLTIFPGITESYAQELSDKINSGELALEILLKAKEYTDEYASRRGDPHVQR